MRWLALVTVAALPLAAAAQDTEGWVVPPRRTAPPLASARPLPPEQDLLARLVPTVDGRLAVEQQGRRRAVTLAPQLQTQLLTTLQQYETPYAAVVVLEPGTGRVLAMVEHSEEDPAMRGLCTKAVYPAASIYKIVSAAALLDTGVKEDDGVCYHGGKRRLSPALLEDSPQDGRCHTLASALGASANVVFAKLTARFLDPERLGRFTKAFRFNTPLDFPVPVEPSLAAIPDETYELALTGAGFGDVYLSPLHGALLASVVANGGVWRSPVLFDGDVGHEERVLAPDVAQSLEAMLAQTVTQGTARRVFHERGFRLPDAVGKTGSLADKTPFRDYTWFVGYAPKEHPVVAAAAVIVNGPKWRIRAPWLGREALRLGLAAAASAPASPAGSTAVR